MTGMGDMDVYPPHLHPWHEKQGKRSYQLGLGISILQHFAAPAYPPGEIPCQKTLD